MREIKFRCYEEENGNMFYSDKEPETLEGYPYPEWVIDETGFWLGIWEFDNWVDPEQSKMHLHKPKQNIMQYTGLKDKNGKEIFEGDIVSDSRSDDCIDIIEWQGYGFGVKYYDESDNALEVPEYWEVIGDVYQNKDLLQ